MSSHPGGISIIAAHSGTDATAIFDRIHPKSMLGALPPSAFLGELDASTLNVSRGDVASLDSDNETDAEIPSIDALINTYDFKAAAMKRMGAHSQKRQGLIYYISAAEDEMTLRENEAVFGRIWFRPRVLIDVSKICTRSKILGFDSAAPFYATATALGKLAHSDGEVAIARAAAAEGIIQMIPTLSSCSIEEICGAAKKGQTQFLQLYVNADREIARAAIAKAKGYGVRALCVTVDAPQLGRRERDMREKLLAIENAPKLERDNFSAKYSERKRQKQSVGGVASSISSFIDPSLCWADLKWIKKECGNEMKVVLKGVQRGEDAVLAVEHGMDAIILSNHGGRQCDYARSGIEVLVEVMSFLDANSMRGQIEVWVDGGFRRGTDIFKALALGATAVGIGRPILFGLACYGQKGVEKIMQIFKNELETTMQMMGTPTLSDIKKNMLVYHNVADHITPVPTNMNARNTAAPLPIAVALAPLNSKM